jgi:hypothetical protein
MAFYVKVIYLNLVSCKVRHSRADTLGHIVTSLTPPKDTEKEIN